MTILTLPRLGETMEEARVTDWLKAPGEAFRRGDVLLEVETDKTVVEVPALQDGVLIAHLVAPGEMVALDQPIAQVSGAASSTAPSPLPAEPITKAALAPQPDPAAPMMPPGIASTGTPRPAASPKARAMARLAGIDLGKVAGTGRRGSITADDLGSTRPETHTQFQTHGGHINLRRHAASSGLKAGAPIILLHGLFDDGRGWRDLPQRLAKAGHPVLVPDLPGHGKSTAIVPDLDAMVDAFTDLLASVLPEGPLQIAGHSMGAIMAVRLALRLQARLERLILISPAGLGPRINPDFLALMTHAETPAALLRGLRMLDAGALSQAALQSALDQLLRQRSAVEPLVRSLARDGIQQIDIAPDLARLGMPVVAVFGLGDQIIDWRCCANLPPRAAIHLVPGAGHQPHSNDPDLIRDLILDRPAQPNLSNGH